MGTQEKYCVGDNKVMRLSWLVVAITLTAHAQSSTKITIVPKQNDSDTGVIDFREKYANGQNYVGWQAPANIASSFRLQLPSALPVNTGTCLTVSSAGIMSFAACSGSVVASDYDWTTTVNSVNAGTRTLTLSPCHINAADTTWAIRVNDATKSEVTFPTGVGTCTVGAATGTVQVVLVNSYTTPAVSSASSGLQEAFYSSDSGHVNVRVRKGTYYVYSDVLTGTRAVNVACDGLGATIMPMANNVKVFNSASATGIRVSGCNFNNATSKTGTVAIYSNTTTGGSYGAEISDNWFSNFDKAIHSAVTVGWVIQDNHFINTIAATAGVHFEGLYNGDAGTGLFTGNILSCSSTCTYGVLWNGPGALQVKQNNFNGYTTQVHAELKFGTASSSGSTVTWVSGNKFRSEWVGSSIIVNGLTAVILSVDNDQQITTSTAIGSSAAANYYVGPTSQAQIISNNFDSGVNTTSAITWAGPVIFQNAQIQNNFVSNWFATNGFYAFNINSSGLNFLNILGNNIQSPASTINVVGIRAEAANTVLIDGNQIVGSDTAISVGSGASTVTIGTNQCTLNDTACVTDNGPSTTLTVPWTKTTNGARINEFLGVNVAPDTSTELKIVGKDSTSNILIQDATLAGIAQFYMTSTFGVVGTQSNHDFLFQSNGSGRWRLEAGGAFRPEAHNTYSFGTTGNRPSTVFTVNLNASGTITAPSGNNGLTGTISVRRGDDAGACNLVVSGGLITSTTCP